jgi:hypothetical protein
MSIIFSTSQEFNSVNLYFEDECRFGLFTRNGKTLTAKGVKPICPFHQVFKSTYLFGAYSPINGDSLVAEMPHCNADMFQLFLDEFSKHLPSELKSWCWIMGHSIKHNHYKSPQISNFCFCHHIAQN